MSRQVSKTPAQRSGVRRWWRWPSAVVGVAVVALVIGVAVRGDSEERAPAVPTATTLDGQSMDIPAPGRPTAVFFFAVGGLECAAWMADLAAVAKAHPGVYYLAVDVSPYDDEGSIRQFLAAANDADRPVARDPRATLAQALGVETIGILVVYDEAGKEIYRGFAPSEADQEAAFTKAEQS